jgi:hypothetical protein
VRAARAAWALAVAVGCAACTAEAKPSGEMGPECSIVQTPRPLPAPLLESSGVAASRRHAGVLWTHNDSGGEPAVYAVDATGRLLGATRIEGATNRDWEDIALGPCASGECLYIADTGDNARSRNDAAIYRVPEPEPGAPTARAERFPLHFPKGKRDTEAIFVLPSGEIFLVSKGRKDPQTLYRFRLGQTETLEPIVDLAGPAHSAMRQITGASASPSGRWVAVRQYKLLTIFRTQELLAGKVAPVMAVDLTPVGEAQGEAVALLDNGRVVLTSEGGFKGLPGTVSILQCALPE